MQDHHTSSADQGRPGKGGGKSELWSFLRTLLLAVVVALLLNNFVITVVTVEGASMEPTVYTNDRVLMQRVSRWFKLPERGDIVICHIPQLDEKDVIKRVVGLPGETVEIHQGIVYINGQVLDEPYLDSNPDRRDMLPVTVDEEHVFVLGDNRIISMDSSSPQVGQIPAEQILGISMLRIWPLSEIGEL
ncbi:MAG: signal peptidase I [Christensenellales bacterium]|jgi:signal peptidase I